MSHSRSDDHTEESINDCGNLLVPEGVLRGIKDIKERNTANKENLESVLKF